MNSFEKLLNTIRKNNPDLISEEAASELMSDYTDSVNAQIDSAKSESFEQGRTAGFEQGFKEGKEAAEALAKSEMNDLLNKCDEEAANKLAAVIEAINADHAEKLENVYQLIVNQTVPKVELAELDKEHAEKFEDAIKAIIDKKDVEVEEKVKEIVDALNEEHALKLQEVVDAIDEKHADELSNVVDAIDEKHAEQLEEAVAAIDKDHAQKLKLACESVKSACLKTAKVALHRAYKETRKEMNALRNTITEQKKQLIESKRELAAQKDKKMDLFAESIEKYLNYALDDAIPVKTVVSEAKYKASQKALEKITSILKLNSVIQESKDGVFNDYERKLQDAKNTQNKLAVECAELRSKLQKEEAKTLLESKISKCTPNEAAFIRNYFANAKNSSVIEEQIDTARKAYRRVYEERRDRIANDSSNFSKPSTLVNSQKPKNELPGKEVVVESKEVKQAKPRAPEREQNVQASYINAYAEVLKKTF